MCWGGLVGEPPFSEDKLRGEEEKGEREGPGGEEGEG